MQYKKKTRINFYAKPDSQLNVVGATEIQRQFEDIESHRCMRCVHGECRSGALKRIRIHTHTCI